MTAYRYRILDWDGNPGESPTMPGDSPSSLPVAARAAGVHAGGMKLPRHPKPYRISWFRFERIKRNARAAVGRALRLGKIQKAATCYHCYRGDIPLVAHHHDYSKPLDVDWLCVRCHREQHVFLADRRFHQWPWTGMPNE